MLCCVLLLWIIGLFRRGFLALRPDGAGEPEAAPTARMAPAAAARMPFP